jgi:penicillin-binding protein 1C
VPAVSLAADVGVPDLLRFLRRAGFTTFDRTAAYYGLGLTLGNAEVRLDELVAAYSAFASGGEWQRPHVRAARDGWSQSAERQILFSPRTAFWIADILADDAARAYIFGRGSSLELPFPVAVKTGTSQAYHDNWTIGFTKRVTVGVWVGNFDRRPLRNSSGVTGAAPIFQAVMLAAHKRIGESDETLHSDGPGVEPREICSLSGEAANSWCPVRRREWLPPGDESVPCSWHHLSEQGLLTIWPPEFREWAGRRAPAGSPRAVPTAGQVREPPVRRVRAASDTSSGLRITDENRVEHQRQRRRRHQLGVTAGVEARARATSHCREGYTGECRGVGCNGSIDSITDNDPTIQRSNDPTVQRSNDPSSVNRASGVKGH